MKFPSSIHFFYVCHACKSHNCATPGHHWRTVCKLYVSTVSPMCHVWCAPSYFLLSLSRLLIMCTFLMLISTFFMVCNRLVYPIDSVRRRMMMEAGRPKPLYKSSLDCARRVLMDEGHRGFYRGLSANLARGIGTSALLVLYDEIRVVFEKM